MELGSLGKDARGVLARQLLLRLLVYEATLSELLVGCDMFVFGSSNFCPICVDYDSPKLHQLMTSRLVDIVVLALADNGDF